VVAKDLFKAPVTRTTDRERMILESAAGDAERLYLDDRRIFRHEP